MKLSASSLILCSGIVLFAACKKNDDTNNNNNNNNSAVKQKLIDGKWQVKGYMASLNYMGKDTTVDLYPDMDNCEKDNFILFADNGTCTQDENTDKCPGKPQMSAFTWGLLNNDTRIYITDSNPDTFDIMEISVTQLKIKKNSNFNGNIGTSTFTFQNIK